MSESSSVFQLVLIDHIRSSPHQARKAFDPESLRSLAESLKQEGLIQPITVRPILDPKSTIQNPQFELVSGERRLRAAKLLGWKSIEAKIIQVISEGEAAAKGLIENLQREDLNPLEEAEGFAELNRVDSSYWTQEKIAQIAGKSRSYVTQSLSLLDLPDLIKEDVRQRTYSRAHAIELSRLPERAVQLKVARQLKLTGLTREKTRQWVDRLRGIKEKPSPNFNKNSIPDPLEGFWPEFVANPWLRPQSPIKVKYLGELRWSFDLPGPKLPPDPISGPEMRTRVRKTLGELMVRMGRSISYEEQGPLMSPTALGDRQVPRAPHGVVPEPCP